MVGAEMAGGTVAGEMAPLGEAVTGSAFMLRPVAEDQFVMILVMSLRKGVDGNGGVSRSL
jgi:hypothetical protein